MRMGAAVGWEWRRSGEVVVLFMGGRVRVAR